jgi:hypothetical protein
MLVFFKYLCESWEPFVWEEQLPAVNGVSVVGTAAEI